MDPPSPAAPGSGVFVPSAPLEAVTNMPTVTPAKDGGRPVKVIVVDPAGVSPEVVAVNVPVGGLMRWVYEWVPISLPIAKSAL